MPTISFTFPAARAGSIATISNDLGAEFLPTPLVLVGGHAVCSLDLPAGTYTAVVGATSEHAHAVLDDASIANQPGISETAFFTGTAPAMDSAGDGDVITFAADGALPAWATIVDGHPTLGAAAGTCAFAIIFAYDFDFSAASGVCGVSGAMSNFTTVELDGVDVFGGSINESTTGDAQDEQTTTPTLRGLTFVGTTLVVTGYPSATEDGDVAIDDAVVSPRFGLTITRLAPKPELP